MLDLSRIVTCIRTEHEIFAYRKIRKNAAALGYMRDAQFHDAMRRQADDGFSIK